MKIWGSAAARPTLTPVCTAKKNHLYGEKKVSLRKYHATTMFSGAMRRRAGPFRATQKLT